VNHSTFFKTIKISEQTMFKPFENATASHAIHDLTLENQEDCVSIYGNLQLTKDQAGLQAAKVLQAFLNDVVSALENEQNLPEKIERQDEQEIENPFL
jgi:hypothetical protein